MGFTYEALNKANNEIKTTPVQKKDYAEVNQRIKAFRKLCPMGCISTEILSLADGVCVMKATVSDEDGNILGTGTAYEKEGSTFINKTSYIENCETSAVGRALGMLGIGIDTSVASAEEVQNAIANQEASKVDAVEDAKVRTEMLKLIQEKNVNAEKLAAQYKVESVMRMTGAQCKDAIRRIKAKEDK